MTKVTVIECDGCGSRTDADIRVRVQNRKVRHEFHGDLCETCANDLTTKMRRSSIRGAKSQEKEVVYNGVSN